MIALENGLERKKIIYNSHNSLESYVSVSCSKLVISVTEHLVKVVD